MPSPANDHDCLRSHLLTDIETAMVDGYVHFGDNRAGLGLKLFDALNGRVAVIGVTKKKFQGAEAALKETT